MSGGTPTRLTPAGNATINKTMRRRIHETIHMHCKHVSTLQRGGGYAFYLFLQKQKRHVSYEEEDT
jgi:hypothetical protein